MFYAPNLNILLSKLVIPVYCKKQILHKFEIQGGKHKKNLSRTYVYVVLNDDG